MGIGGVTEIRGVAHPAPSKFGRGNRADLSRAEIQSTNLAGKPLLNEHSSDERVGTVLTSWEGRDGSLRIAAHVEDPTAQQQVRDGTLRGLSLGTDMILATDGSVAYRSQAELSICAEVSTQPTQPNSTQPNQPNQRKAVPLLTGAGFFCDRASGRERGWTWSIIRSYTPSRHFHQNKRVPANKLNDIPVCSLE